MSVLSGTALNCSAPRNCKTPITVQHESHLIIIDEDEEFFRLISEYLAKFGYEVSMVADAQEGLNRLQTEQWQAAMINVELPTLDGFDVLKQLRRNSKLPVILLGSMDDEEQKLLGFELGADDCISKTVSLRAILAKLRALSRRAPDALPPRRLNADELTIGLLTIEKSTSVAKLDGKDLRLTAIEFTLLLVLAISDGRIKSRQELVEEVCHRDFNPSDRAIDVHISSLRKKLGDNPRSPCIIRTVRGAGYALCSKSIVDRWRQRF